MKLQKNKQPKLNLPTFTVDGELSKKLNEYEITKLMNKSNVTLFFRKSRIRENEFDDIILKYTRIIL